MIEIKEVKTKKEQKEFLNFPLKLYKNNPYFVPPLYVDEKKIFNKKYFYYQTSKAIYYNAYKNGKMVGRISAILQMASNEKWNKKQVRFTRFDSINDQEVADLLFQSVENWAKKQGMEEVIGPLGFSDFEREGLLIEGFDELSTFEEQYNYDYYQKLIENNGYKKEVDWVERKIYSASVEDEKRVERIVNIIMKRDGFKLLLSPFYIRLIVDKNDELAAFGLCFPSISKAIQKSGGHLTLPTIIRILKAKKHPEIIDLGLIGVNEKYLHSGVAWGIFLEIMRYLHTGNIQYCETNLNLEDNEAIQNNWSRFKNVLHKRRRCYIKKI